MIDNENHQYLTKVLLKYHGVGKLISRASTRMGITNFPPGDTFQNTMPDRDKASHHFSHIILRDKHLDKFPFQSVNIIAHYHHHFKIAAIDFEFRPDWLPDVYVLRACIAPTFTGLNDLELRVQTVRKLDGNASIALDRFSTQDFNLALDQSLKSAERRIVSFGRTAKAVIEGEQP